MIRIIIERPSRVVSAPVAVVPSGHHHITRCRATTFVYTAVNEIEDHAQVTARVVV